MNNGQLTRSQCCWVVVLAAGDGAVLSGPTAAELDGLTGFATRQIHITVPQGRPRVDLPNVITHWSTQLGHADVHPTRLAPRTRIERSVVDMVAWAQTEERARAVIAGAVQQRLVLPERIRDAAGRRRRFKRSALLVETLVDVEGGAHSVPELEFNHLIVFYRLPAPQRQRIVQGPDGRYYLDAAWEDFGVGAEVQGIPHVELAQWDDDLDRNNEITADGRRMMHFPSFAIRHRAARVAELLARSLRTGGWDGVTR